MARRVRNDGASRTVGGVQNSAAKEGRQMEAPRKIKRGGTIGSSDSMSEYKPENEKPGLEQLIVHPCSQQLYSLR